MPRFASAARAATTASPSSDTPFNWQRPTFHASSASRPVVAASPFMTQAQAKTSAVLASTYVPLTVAGVAASVANTRLDSATDTAIFFMTFLLPTCIYSEQQHRSPQQASGTTGSPIGPH